MCNTCLGHAFGSLDGPCVLQRSSQSSSFLSFFFATFAPGTLDDLNLCERFPGLVVLSITPYGQHGPYRDRVSSDLTIQAESGGIAGRGLASQPPVHRSLADRPAALLLCSAQAVRAILVHARSSSHRP
mgnify:CR=1 FL=1